MKPRVLMALSACVLSLTLTSASALAADNPEVRCVEGHCAEATAKAVPKGTEQFGDLYKLGETGDIGLSFKTKTIDVDSNMRFSRIVFTADDNDFEYDWIEVRTTNGATYRATQDRVVEEGDSVYMNINDSGSVIDRITIRGGQGQWWGGKANLKVYGVKGPGSVTTKELGSTGRIGSKIKEKSISVSTAKKIYKLTFKAYHATFYIQRIEVEFDDGERYTLQTIYDVNVAKGYSVSASFDNGVRIKKIRIRGSRAYGVRDDAELKVTATVQK